MIQTKKNISVTLSNYEKPETIPLYCFSFIAVYFRNFSVWKERLKSIKGELQ